MMYKPPEGYDIGEAYRQAQFIPRAPDPCPWMETVYVWIVSAAILGYMLGLL